MLLSFYRLRLNANSNPAITVKKLKFFLWGYFHKCRLIAGLIFSTVYLLSVLGIIFSGAVLTPKQSADTPITNYSTIENNLNTINLLQENIWKNLSLQDRMNILQTTANIEASYLGLPHELNVISAVMDEETLGYYNDQIHTVAFNIDFLRQGNSADILETLTHEAFLATIRIFFLRKKCFIAVRIQLQCSRFIHQHEAKHHLDCQQQGVEIPNHSGPIFQLNMVFRRNALNRCPTGPLNFPGLFFHFIIIFIRGIISTFPILCCQNNVNQQ